jgi:hypothetical protein
MRRLYQLSICKSQDFTAGTVEEIGLIRSVCGCSWTVNNLLRQSMNDSADKRSDGESIEAAKKGDLDAFETLYHRYRHWVFSVACRFCRNEDDAWGIVRMS